MNAPSLYGRRGTSLAPPSPYSLPTTLLPRLLSTLPQPPPPWKASVLPPRAPPSSLPSDNMDNQQVEKINLCRRLEKRKGSGRQNKMVMRPVGEQIRPIRCMHTPNLSPVSGSHPTFSEQCKLAPPIEVSYIQIVPLWLLELTGTNEPKTLYITETSPAENPQYNTVEAVLVLLHLRRFR